jgi:hypothetical protein
MLCLAANALAAIPLITDDTGTQGKDKFQFELLGEYGRDEGERVTVSSSNFVATLTYGVIDPVDIILSIPYQYSPAKDSESVVKGNGISDSAIEAKWRFYEKDRVSFALKPGFTLPVGDEQKGLGAGRVTYYLYFITSKEISPWAIHANLAYFRNENTVDQRKNIWHASFASTVEVVENLKLAGDIGVRSNPDKSSKTPPAYVLGGLIYSLNNDLDVGLGVKGGLSRPEADIAVRGGITWRF